MITRSLIFALLIPLFGMAFRPAIRPPFSVVAGTWKRTSMVLIDGSGKKTEMMEMMSRTMPCTKDITYTFTSDGQLKTNVPDACGAMKKTIEGMNVSGRWAQTGQKVTVTTTMRGIQPATYDLSFQGNTMTWVFIYADNPKTSNPTKAQRITIVYQRV